MEKKVTAGQLQEVLNNLPDPRKVYKKTLFMPVYQHPKLITDPNELPDLNEQLERFELKFIKQAKQKADGDNPYEWVLIL